MTAPKNLPPTGLQLRSLVKPEGVLEISLVDEPVPTPGADEVVVRVDATPINPSDIGLLFGAGDTATATASGTAKHPVVTLQIPAPAMKAMAGRLGQAMPVGNEGAGTVVAAGASAAAQALLGKTVAVLAGAMYSQYRCVSAAQCAGETPVCESNRCVAATACASSRMCPGRVCDVALGRCVEILERFVQLGDLGCGDLLLRREFGDKLCPLAAEEDGRTAAFLLQLMHGIAEPLQNLGLLFESGVVAECLPSLPSTVAGEVEDPGKGDRQ